MSTGSRASARLARRLAGAGAAGVSAVLAIAPLAHAETSEPAPTSSAPVEPPATPASTEAAASAGTVRPLTDPIAADYGGLKVRVGVRLATGAYLPDGADTMGSQLTVVEKDSSGEVFNTVDCTTSVRDADDPTLTLCDFGILPDDVAYLAPAPGSTLDITQTATADGLHVTSEQPLHVGPCADPTDVESDFAFCDVDAFIDNAGTAPAVPVAHLTVVQGESIDFDVAAQLDRDPSSISGYELTTPPAHGTTKPVARTSPETGSTSATQASSPSTGGASTFARVRPMAVTPGSMIRYTADGDYVGPDGFDYTASTTNGPLSGRVEITVIPAPASAPAPAPTASETTTSTPVPTASTPTTTLTPIAPSHTTATQPHPINVDAQQLAATGADNSDLLALGGGLLLVGGAALGYGRRRTGSHR